MKVKCPRYRISDPLIQGVLNDLADFIDNNIGGKKIITGSNIRKTEDSHTITLHGLGSSVTRNPNDPCPFDVTFKRVKDSDPREYDVYCNAGTVNQLLASNWDASIGTVEKEDLMYVIIHCDITTEGEITDAQLKLESTYCEALEISENELPQAVDILIGVIDERKWKRVLACGSILISPAVAFNTAGSTWWTWKISVQ